MAFCALWLNWRLLIHPPRMTTAAVYYLGFDKGIGTTTLADLAGHSAAAWQELNLDQFPTTGPMVILLADVWQNMQQACFTIEKKAPAGSLVLLPVLSQPLYKQLKQVGATAKTKLLWAGYSSWPGALAQELWELSVPEFVNRQLVADLLSTAGLQGQYMQDELGLASPRVVAMVINEAYYTLEEGTATVPDIDKSMRLGVNYPAGPFEWAQRIGIKRVLALLDALWLHTHDVRYKACLSLRRAAEQG